MGGGRTPQRTSSRKGSGLEAPDNRIREKGGEIMKVLLHSIMGLIVAGIVLYVFLAVRDIWFIRKGR